MPRMSFSKKERRRKEGRNEGTKEGRKEMKEGRKEGREGRKEETCIKGKRKAGNHYFNKKSKGTKRARRRCKYY